MKSALPERMAERIVQGFEHYMAEFRRLTLRARMRFEQQDWGRAQADWVARLDCVGQMVRQTLEAVNAVAAEEGRDRRLWTLVRRAYREAIALRGDAEIAE